jgi:hypothetical protein
MVFDVHSQALLSRVKGRAFGHGPGPQRAVHFEAQVIVQAAGAVALDVEAIPGRGRPGYTGRLGYTGWRGLGSALEAALAAVFIE